MTIWQAVASHWIALVIFGTLFVLTILVLARLGRIERPTAEIVGKVAAVVGILGLAFIGLTIDDILHNKEGFAFATLAIGVITFFIFVPLDDGRKCDVTTGKPSDRMDLERIAYNKERFGDAIAAAVIIQFLVIVGFVVYFESTTSAPPKISETFIDKFLWVVTVVVGFYFGEKAVSKVADRVTHAITNKPAPPTSGVVVQQTPRSGSQQGKIDTSRTG